MADTKIGLKRKALYVFILALFCLIVLEIVARVTAPDHPWLNPRYVELSKGFGDIEGLIDDVGWGPGDPHKYYEEFLYAAAPRSHKHVTYTDYHSARLAPASVPLSEATVIVWAFGGSTLDDFSTTDSMTIANTWARLFNRTLGPTHVKNFGTRGFFSSHELIKFQKLLRDVPDEEHPTIAIFYDGYNETLYGFQYGAGRMQRDLSLKLQALVEQRRYALWAYTSSEILGRWSTLWYGTGKPLVDRVLFPLGEPDRSAENLLLTVRNYVSNVRMLQGTCNAFGIRCVFVLQPLLVTKEPLSDVEIEALEAIEGHARFGKVGTNFVRMFYAQVAELLADEPDFVDASAVLNGRIQGDFYDIGHVGALSSPIIGERVGNLIVARLAGKPE